MSDFIEVKEGSVNDEVFEVMKARDPDEYLKFFRQVRRERGEAGRTNVQQRQVADDRIKLFGLQPGVYDEERAIPWTELKVGEDGSFHEVIEPLIQQARTGKYSVETIGDCLVLAALDATSQERYLRTDYVARCVAHAAFGDDETREQEKLLRALQRIEFPELAVRFWLPYFVFRPRSDDSRRAPFSIFFKQRPAPSLTERLLFGFAASMAYELVSSRSGARIVSSNPPLAER